MYLEYQISQFYIYWLKFAGNLHWYEEKLSAEDTTVGIVLTDGIGIYFFEELNELESELSGVYFWNFRIWMNYPHWKMNGCVQMTFRKGKYLNVCAGGNLILIQRTDPSSIVTTK